MAPKVGPNLPVTDPHWVEQRLVDGKELNMQGTSKQQELEKMMEAKEREIQKKMEELDR